MKALKKYPFYLFFLVLFFCLHGAAENFSSISFQEVLFVGISVLLAILGLFFVFYIAFRNVFLASLTTIFIGTWYFFFGAFHDFIKGSKNLIFLQPYKIILPLLILVTILWVIFLYKNKSKWQHLTLYLNALFLIYSMVDSINLVIHFSKINPSLKVSPFNYSLVKQKPNVYFLLFDGYPGQKSLSDTFHFDNNEFYSFLKKNQFRQIPIHSNYDYTLYSMPSMFNMHYVNNNYVVNQETQSDSQLRQNEINQGVIFNIFKKMGYLIINNSVFDIEDLPGLSDENSFLLGHSILLTNKILINRIKKDLTYLFTDRQIKYLPFLKNQSVFIDRNNNLKAEKLTTTLAAAKKNNHYFCYAHLLLPHAPYFYDSLGRETDYTKMTNNDVVLNKTNFISYLKYTNSVAKNIISNIRKNDSSAIVIFLSDHGVRSFPRKPYIQPSNFDNICFVFFPDKNYIPLPANFTNVNIFPFLFNTEFNQSLSYLKDTSITYIPSSK